MSLFEPKYDSCWDAKSQHAEKMLWRMAVLQLLLCIRIKGGDLGELPEIHWWQIRERGKAKQGSLRFYISGYRRVNNEHLWHMEMVLGTRQHCGAPDLLLGEVGVPWGSGRGITQAFQRFVISDAKTQQTGSPKIKIDLCRGNHRPRT